MNENTHSFADLIIGQGEQGMRSEEVSNTHGLTQAQRQVVEKLEADPIEHGTDSADTMEHLLASQETLQPTRRGISRRTVMLRLAKLTVVGAAGSSLVLLACSQQPTAPSRSVSTPTLLSVRTTLYIYRGHDPRFMVSAVAWSPDGKRIASGSWDETVQVWDAADGGHVYTYRRHIYSVYTVAWSPDGKRIASGALSPDNTVQVWDAVNGGNVYTYRGHAHDVYAVAWSPDSKHIASASFDGTVQVWDTVYAVTWSPDGKRIASGSFDRTVQVWDAANGGHVYTYNGHSDFVSTVAWSPDGKRIASGGNDGTVQVWMAA